MPDIKDFYRDNDVLYEAVTCYREDTTTTEVFLYVSFYQKG